MTDSIRDRAAHIDQFSKDMQFLVLNRKLHIAGASRSFAEVTHALVRQVAGWYPIEYHSTIMASLEDTYRDRASELLRESREAAGLSLRELARRAGTSHATLIAYERGIKVPSVVTFVRVLESCGLAVDFVTSKRMRSHEGLARGDELAAVLKLAEQFPSRAARHMDYPMFPDA